MADEASISEGKDSEICRGIQESRPATPRNINPPSRPDDPPCHPTPVHEDGQAAVEESEDSPDLSEITRYEPSRPP